MIRARLLAGCLMLVLVVPAAARDTGPVRRPSRPAASPVAAMPVPAAMPQTAIGLCQCLADRSKRNITCLSSADQCQATCASTHYSFVPFAPNCPATAAR
jgi:hypothetical protein